MPTAEQHEMELLRSRISRLEAQLEWERQGISNCAAHPDGREGIRAFVEKREASF